MSNSSILGGQRAARQAEGRDVDALGPSDSSDSGSDVQGERPMSTEADNPGEWGSLPVERHGDSDSMGTGERASATGDDGPDGADILPDRVTDLAGGVETADDETNDIEGLADDDGEADAAETEGAGEAEETALERRR